MLIYAVQFVTDIFYIRMTNYWIGMETFENTWLKLKTTLFNYLCSGYETVESEKIVNRDNVSDSFFFSYCLFVPRPLLVLTFISEHSSHQKKKKSDPLSYLGVRRTWNLLFHFTVIYARFLIGHILCRWTKFGLSKPLSSGGLLFW